MKYRRQCEIFSGQLPTFRPGRTRQASVDRRPESCANHRAPIARLPLARRDPKHLEYERQIGLAQARLLTLSSNAKQIFVPNSSEYVQFDAPGTLSSMPSVRSTIRAGPPKSISDKSSKESTSSRLAALGVHILGEPYESQSSPGSAIPQSPRGCCESVVDTERGRPPAPA